MIVRKACDVPFTYAEDLNLKRKWLVHKGVGDDSYGHRFAVREFIHEPKQEKKVPFHRHNYVEAVYIVSGRGIFRTETEKVEVEPGDLVYVASNEYHALNIIGDKLLHTICCIDCVDDKSCDPEATDVIMIKTEE